MAYGVLVVDDSALIRRAIREVIHRDLRFHVVGVARNGLDAIDKVKRLRPALITMDVEMPEMDGVTAVRKLMAECPVPIVMLSSLTGPGTHTTVQALQAGALDCVFNDRLLGEGDPHAIQDFHACLEAASTATMNPPSEIVPSSPVRTAKNASATVDAVFIGCSTGGPAALQSILPLLPETLPVPVTIAQHMPPGFTKSLAARFDTMCRIRVKEAEDGEVLQKGTVYIAPSGIQTMVSKSGGRVTWRTTPSDIIETRFRPYVDILLLSAAPICRDRMPCIILTGMETMGLWDVRR
ncbi:MAG: chemotaxis-specific protein-glutamate methyltransferase CheB [Alicyclobacillus sp.]|nr:chemotaxis-specific protein-glutamate methyltransferase CheB [Alicyclobacillus sp.]